MHTNIYFTKVTNPKKNQKRGGVSIITLVGGGGKTSFICYLARAMTAFGCKIVATTTTKLCRGGPNPGELVFAQTFGECRAVIEKYQAEKKVLTLVKNVSTFDTTKVEGFLPEFVDDLAGYFTDTLFIVEGDGAAGKPFKGHHETEPVIPQKTRLLLPVVGIDALGKPLSEEYVHRVKKIIELTGRPYGAIIDSELINSLLLSKTGYLRNCPPKSLIIPVINKAATRDEINKASELADSIIKLKIPRIKGVIIGDTRQECFTYITKNNKYHFGKILKKLSIIGKNRI